MVAGTSMNDMLAGICNTVGHARFTFKVHEFPATIVRVGINFCAGRGGTVAEQHYVRLAQAEPAGNEAIVSTTCGRVAADLRNVFKLTR